MVFSSGRTKVVACGHVLQLSCYGAYIGVCYNLGEKSEQDDLLLVWENYRNHAICNSQLSVLA